jgi:hypothetical protein
MNTPEIIEQLKKSSQLCRGPSLFHFRCHRESAGTHTVDVDITDMGQSNPNARYSVIATQDDGKTASGNSGRTIQQALAMVHWFNLD